MEEARKKRKPWCNLRSREVKTVYCGKQEECLLHKACFFCLQSGFLHKIHQFHNENEKGENAKQCPKVFGWREWYSKLETEKRALVARSFG